MKAAPRAALALALAMTPALILAPADPALAQTRRHWKRGDILPPATLKAGPNANYAAQRLRRPPAGYGWFALDGQLLLASLATGLILDVVD